MAKTDIEDVIDAIEDALTAAESLRGKDTDDRDVKAVVIDAINQIRRGDYAEAITTLEREFMPKWKDKDAAERAYKVATGVDPIAREVGREVERAMATDESVVKASGGGIGPY